MADFTRRAWRGLAPNSAGLVETATYIWNTNTLAWEPASGSTTGTLVSVSNFPATQPVSGTVTVTQPLDTRSKAYSIRIDPASSTVTYYGYATVGSSEAAAVWQIKKKSVSGSITSYTFADGDELYDNVWANRAGLSYS